MKQSEDINYEDMKAVLCKYIEEYVIPSLKPKR